MFVGVFLGRSFKNHQILKEVHELQTIVSTPDAMRRDQHKYTHSKCATQVMALTLRQRVPGVRRQPGDIQCPEGAAGGN